jgi:hypothetical protein
MDRCLKLRGEGDGCRIPEEIFSALNITGPSQ